VSELEEEKQRGSDAGGDEVDIVRPRAADRLKYFEGKEYQ